MHWFRVITRANPKVAEFAQRAPSAVRCHPRLVLVYLRILRTPGVAPIVAATVVGRLPIGISGLAILLFVQETTGSFASAGVCAGALALGSAAGAPFQGRLVDRRGDGSLIPLAIAHAAGLILVWALGGTAAPVVPMALASLAAGAALPPLTSVLRSRWAYLLEPELVPGAFALDSVLIEVIFVTGPLLTTAVVATVGPEYALAVSAACVLSGTGMMLAGLHDKPGPERGTHGGRALGLGALAAPGLRTLVAASLPVGFALGTLEVVLPAFSADEGSKALAGVLLAVWSAASGAAGLAYGTRVFRRPLTDVHLRLACLLPPACAVLLAAGSPLSMALLVIVAGAPIAPLIASRNQLVERVAPRGTATEAFTWPLTALVSGVSLGAATSGALVEAYSWSAGVAAAAAVSALGALVLLARRKTLEPSVVTAG
jgi:predicted MFS family arabinose efflux permease